jgi:hypothetical protein
MINSGGGRELLTRIRGFTIDIESFQQLGEWIWGILLLDNWLTLRSFGGFSKGGVLLGFMCRRLTSSILSNPFLVFGDLRAVHP